MNNIEAEKKVLGLIINDNSLMGSVTWLKAGHFSYEPHFVIWEAMIGAIQSGAAATPVTLSSLFDLEIDQEKPAYLYSLVAAVEPNDNVEQLAAIVRDCFVRREIVRASEATIQRARTLKAGDGPIRMLGDIMGGAQSLMYGLPDKGKQDSVSDIVGAMLDRLRTGKVEKGIPTGLRKLTERIGGFMPGDFIVVGARPGMGKTLALWHFCKAAAHAASKDPLESGAPCLISLEMSQEQVLMRALSDAAFQPGREIPYSPLMKGRVDQPWWLDELEAAKERLSALPMVIDDSMCRTVPEIEAAARSADKRLREQGSKLGILLIDYLGLMGGDRDSNTSRQQQIAAITRGLKSLAKRLGIPIVAAHQVGRGVESRDDKRPQLSDLREAGDIEQDADVVIFLYREHYYKQRGMPPKSDAKYTDWAQEMDSFEHLIEFITSKQRNGSTGIDKAWISLPSGRIADTDPTPNSEAFEL